MQEKHIYVLKISTIFPDQEKKKEFAPITEEIILLIWSADVFKSGYGVIPGFFPGSFTVFCKWLLWDNVNFFMGGLGFVFSSSH